MADSRIGRSLRVASIMDSFKVFRISDISNKFEFNSKQLNSLLEVAFKKVDSSLLLDTIKLSPVKSPREYVRWMYKLGSVGRIDEAENVFIEFKKYFPNKTNKSAYNTLMTVYNLAHKYQQTHELYKEVIEKGLVPDKLMYKNVVFALCKLDDEENLNQILRELNHRHITIDSKLLKSVIEMLCRTGKVDQAMYLAYKWEDLLSSATFFDLIDGYLTCGNKSMALKILKRYELNGKRIRWCQKNMMKQVCVVDKDFEKALTICKRFYELGYSPKETWERDLIQHCGKDADKMIDIMYVFAEFNMFPNCLSQIRCVKACKTIHQLRRFMNAIHNFHELKALNGRYSSKALIALIRKCIEFGDMEDALDVLKLLLKLGVDVEESFSLLLLGFIKQRDIPGVDKLFHILQNQGIKPFQRDLPPYSTLEKLDVESFFLLLEVATKYNILSIENTRRLIFKELRFRRKSRTHAQSRLLLMVALKPKYILCKDIPETFMEINDFISLIRNVIKLGIQPCSHLLSGVCDYYIEHDNLLAVKELFYAIPDFTNLDSVLTKIILGAVRNKDLGKAKKLLLCFKKSEKKPHDFDRPIYRLLKQDMFVRKELENVLGLCKDIHCKYRCSAINSPTFERFLNLYLDKYGIEYTNLMLEELHDTDPYIGINITCNAVLKIYTTLNLSEKVFAFIDKYGVMDIPNVLHPNVFNQIIEMLLAKKDFKKTLDYVFKYMNANGIPAKRDVINAILKAFVHANRYDLAYNVLEELFTSTDSFYSPIIDKGGSEYIMKDLVHFFLLDAPNVDLDRFYHIVLEKHTRLVMGDVAESISSLGSGVSSENLELVDKFKRYNMHLDNTDFHSAYCFKSTPTPRLRTFDKHLKFARETFKLIYSLGIVPDTCIFNWYLKSLSKNKAKSKKSKILLNSKTLKGLHNIMKEYYITPDVETLVLIKSLLLGVNTARDIHFKAFLDFKDKYPEVTNKYGN